VQREKQFQISDFENIDWAPVLSGRHVTSSYLVRKGLARKAQLANQIKRYCSKHEGSLLRSAVPFTVVIETWDAFEDMRLDFGGGTFATFDTSMTMRSTPLRQRLQFLLEEAKEIVESPERIDWLWILKPSVTNKGSI